MRKFLREFGKFISGEFKSASYVLSDSVSHPIPMISHNSNDRFFTFTVTKMKDGKSYTGLLQNDNVVDVFIAHNGNKRYTSKEEVIRHGLVFYKKFLQPSGWDILPEIVILNHAYTK